jgi:hypothetical protein
LGLRLKVVGFVNVEIIGAPALIFIGAPKKRLADESIIRILDVFWAGSSIFFNSSVLQE